MILDPIVYQPDRETLMRRLHIKPSSPDAGEFDELVQQAQTLARPKVIFEQVSITEKDRDEIAIGGYKFSSRVLRVNLKETQQVFIYVATCGVELEDWANQLTDMLHSFWSGAIREAALYAVTDDLGRYLDEHYHMGHLSTMHPGSLKDWPLSEQRPLFNLLGDVKGAIGVELTDSLLMVPTKSVSGVIFPTEADFQSCQLCQRDDCPNRQAPYDEMLYAQKYL